MMRPLMIASGIACVVALSTLVFAAWRHTHAITEHRDATRTAARLATDTAELRRLRATTPRAFLNKPPDADVIAAVHRTLESVGLPRSTVGRLVFDLSRPNTGDAGTTEPATSRVRLNLQTIAPPRLGSFLATWRDAEPLWIPVEMTLDSARNAPGAYNVQLMLEARYIAAPNPKDPAND